MDFEEGNIKAGKGNAAPAGEQRNAALFKGGGDSQPFSIICISA